MRSIQITLLLLIIACLALPFSSAQEISDTDTSSVEQDMEPVSENLEENFRRAIENREKGYFTSALLRKLIWRKSEKYFKAVLAVDSTYNKVLYEYSILKGYKEEYWNAIDLLKAYRQFEPDDMTAYYKIYFYYDAICQDPEDEDLQKLNGNGNFNRYFLGEYYRQHDRLDEAKPIFESMLHFGSISPTAVNLSLARTTMQQNRPELAEAYYKEAMNIISNWYDATILFNDIKYIYSDAEIEFYNRLLNPNQAKIFFMKSWMRRSPNPSISLNTRIIEHLQRTLYAEKLYRQVRIGPKRYQAIEEQDIKVPAVYKLADRYDDRGLIYIRYGAPDDIAIATGGDGAASIRGKPWYEDLNSGESWLYNQTSDSPKQIFHFGHNLLTWEITPLLPVKMLEDCITWDKQYFQLYNSQIYHGNEMESRQLEQAMTIENEEKLEHRLQVDVYKPKNKQNFNIPYYLAAFARQENTGKYELYYSLSEELRNTTLDSLPVDSKVQFGLGIFDQNWNPLHDESNIITLKEIYTGMDTLGYWPGLYNFNLETGNTYYINFYTRIPNYDMLWGEKFKFTPGPINNQSMYMSDPELASVIVPTNLTGPMRKNNLLVIPKPDLNFVATNPVYVYFELYNLPINATEAFEYTIQYKLSLLEKQNNGFFKSITGLFTGNKNKLAVKVDGYAQSTETAEYTGLDLSKLDPGIYMLEISVSAPQYDINLSKSINIKLLEDNTAVAAN